MGIGKKIVGRGCFVRDEYILDHCRGRRVLHIGCTDYPFFSESLSKGYLLHEKIDKVAREVIGVDTASEDVKAMIAHGYDVRLLDAQKLGGYEWGESFDVILLADVLEHIPNVGIVIDQARKLLSEKGEFIVTVPNAFGIVRFLKSIFRYEQVHPDHVAYYSSGILENLSNHLALTIKEMAWYRFEVRDKRPIVYLSSAIERACTLFSPWYAEGCIAIMTCSSQNDNV